MFPSDYCFCGRKKNECSYAGQDDLVNCAACNWKDHHDNMTLTASKEMLCPECSAYTLEDMLMLAVGKGNHG